MTFPWIVVFFASLINKVLRFFQFLLFGYDFSLKFGQLRGLLLFSSILGLCTLIDFTDLAVDLSKLSQYEIDLVSQVFVHNSDLSAFFANIRNICSYPL